MLVTFSYFFTQLLLHDQRVSLQTLTGGLPVYLSVYDGDSWLAAPDRYDTA
jgi:hypothetical protein